MGRKRVHTNNAARSRLYRTRHLRQLQAVLADTPEPPSREPNRTMSCSGCGAKTSIERLPIPAYCRGCHENGTADRLSATPWRKEPS